ncbi:MAG TPA: MMPL family transporter [Steroidobacteraceae bacterium]|jgi:predicted exporter|nr:MMPL family transporter [Steroidobacteraceae bacterium]
MSARRAWIVGAWLSSVALAAWAAVDARYVADLSAFLPAHPTPGQQLLVDQLREGPGSRLMMIALEGGDGETRARLSVALAGSLRGDRRFSTVGNGRQVTAERDREVLFAHRYLLSEAVTPQHFTAAGLKQAIENTIADLASPLGLALGPLAARDPTGEMLAVIEQLSRSKAPRPGGGVWTSADGMRTLLIAETAAGGSDTDAQESAMGAVRAAFDRAVHETRDPAARRVELVMSGPGVFAVAARAKIEHAVVRLSLAGSALVVITLLAVYRSALALLLGLLPVATGALVGVAAVALGFGVVHGITLGFGITLIGEAVDYSIYFFIQSAGGDDAAAQRWERQLWPTLRLGMLTSVCGFASLLPSQFPGLAQLGAYSVSGLLAAAAVTRFVLPVLLPRRFSVRDLAPAGRRIALVLRSIGPDAPRLTALGLAGASLAVLFFARHDLWNRELSSLSPIPIAEQRLDAELRSDLGAADSLDLVVVPGATLDAALRGAELAARALEPLVEHGAVGGFDNPALFLPSLATQAARRASLPDPRILARNLDEATQGLAIDAGRLTAFEQDVEAARRAPPMSASDLAGTSMAAGLGALTMRSPGGWNALLPLHAADAAHPRGARPIDMQAVRHALAEAHSSARVLDLKQESDALYSDYLREALRLCAAGGGAIAVLLVLALRSPLRAARVLAPLALAVLVVAAGLVLLGVRLTILHLVGMLLIVAIGSNYALFFDSQRRGSEQSPTTLVSLCIANACTVLAFGLLSFSGVPVLEALGTTVAPGALIALIFAAVLTPLRGGGAAPVLESARA